MNCRIVIISPEILPVPPIKGGAVESWIYEIITRLPKSYSIQCLGIFDNRLSKFEIQGNIIYQRFKLGLFSKIFTLTYKLPFKRSDSCLYWITYSLWCAWKSRRFKANIIHIHNRIQFVPIIKFLNPKSKIILHIHNLSALNYKRVWNNRILRKIDLLLGCSKFLAQEMKCRFSDYKDIAYVYNGYAKDRFIPYWLRMQERQKIREKFNIENSEKVILYIGRIAKNKGIHLLLESFLNLEKNYPKIKLVIVGGETESDESSHKYFLYLKKLASNVRKGKVIFTGKVQYSQIHKYYLLGDILVIPSTVEEGLCLVALEGMACGIPIVTSGRGGISEVIQDNKTGLLVNNVETIEELQEKIDGLLSNENLRTTLGKAGYEFIKDNFTWETITKNIENIYCKICYRRNTLFFEPSSGFGGSGNSLFNLLKFLNQEKFKPLVVTLNDGPQFTKIKELGVKIIKLHAKEIEPENNEGVLTYLKLFYQGIFYLLPLTLKLLFIIKKYKIDLLHINTNIISGIPAILAGKMAGIPCICHIRQTRRPIKREKFFFRWIDKIILLNQKAKEIYLEDTQSNKLSLIYDGLDLEGFKPKNDRERITKEFNLNGSPCVGVLGRLVEGKGLDDFIKASALVLKEKPETKFFIVGSDPSEDKHLEKELKSLAQTLNLNGNLIFTGWRNDVSDLISSFDVLVQPSSSFPEGFGLTCIEAMALGKPVVATNIPGPQDIVVDGKTGFLVPAYAPTSLAEAILKLLNNPQLAKNMGEEGRERAEELFDIRKNVKKIEALYEEILKDR